MINFVINKNKFQLFLNNKLVSESYFTIEKTDEWFNQKYVTLFNLKTIKQFRQQGYAYMLLQYIFKYTLNQLNINIISLNVYKKNINAVNLYFKCNFVKFIDYDDETVDKSYFTLIKNLKDLPNFITIK